MQGTKSLARVWGGAPRRAWGIVGSSEIEDVVGEWGGGEHAAEGKGVFEGEEALLRFTQGKVALLGKGDGSRAVI